MSVIVGSFGTVTVRFVVRRAAGSVVDFTEATAAAIGVRWPKLTPSPSEEFVETEWVPTVDVQSESLAYLFYTLQDGDIPRVGDYGISVALTTGSGPIPCMPAVLNVIDRF